MALRNELSVPPSELEENEDSVSLTESTATETEENAVKNPVIEKEAEKPVISASLIEPVKEESKQEDKNLIIESIVVDIPSDSEEEPALNIVVPNPAAPDLLRENTPLRLSGAGLMPTPRSPRFEDLAEKDSPLSDDESVSEESENNFENEYSKLFKRWNFLDKKTQKSRAWMLQDLMTHFTAAKTYDLDEHEEQILLEDLEAVNEVLEAEESFINSKDDDGNFDVAIKKDFQSKLDNLLKCAADEPSRKREIFIKIGIALSALAVGVTVGVLLAGLSPFIVAGCALATVALLAGSAISLYYLNNHTFFGQLHDNRALMANLALSTANTLEPEKVGCFGKA